MRGLDAAGSRLVTPVTETVAPPAKQRTRRSLWPAYTSVCSRSEPREQRCPPGSRPFTADCRARAILPDTQEGAVPHQDRPA
eukprot:3459272-Prymnesium_polylepis.1